jgi:hypothetical protein
MTGNTDMYLLVTDSFLIKVEAWIRKPVSIWCDHHLPHAERHIPLHRVHPAVDCGLWNVVPLLFNGCAKLLDIGGNWNTLSYTSLDSQRRYLQTTFPHDAIQTTRFTT